MQLAWISSNIWKGHLFFTSGWAESISVGCRYLSSIWSHIRYSLEQSQRADFSEYFRWTFLSSNNESGLRMKMNTFPYFPCPLLHLPQLGEQVSVIFISHPFNLYSWKSVFFSLPLSQSMQLSFFLSLFLRKQVKFWSCTGCTQVGKI